MSSYGSIVFENTSQDLADAIGVWIESKQELVVYFFDSQLSEAIRQEILRDPLVSFGQQLLVARSVMAFHGCTGHGTWNPAAAFHARLQESEAHPSSWQGEYTIAFFGPENVTIGTPLSANDFNPLQFTPPTTGQHGAIAFESQGDYHDSLLAKHVAWTLRTNAQVVTVPFVHFNDLLPEGDPPH